MNGHPALPCRQHGAAVIMALLLTSLAITIVANLFWQQQVQVRSIENQRLQLQQQWIMRGALDWAGLILREDARHSTVDHLDEPWAVPLAETRLDQYIENGNAGNDATDAALSGSISDAQSRFNLTNLCPNGMIIPAEVAAFARLLENLRLDPKLAQATADTMAAALAKPQISAGNNSQPSAEYLNLTQLNDLLAVPGFSLQILDKLKDFVIFLPRPTPVNANTAPAEVLASKINKLTLADASSLVTSRNSANFRDIADLTNRLPGNPFSVSTNQVSVTTQYFLVNGKVRINRARLETQALIERNSSNNTKLIWVQEY